MRTWLTVTALAALMAFGACASPTPTPGPTAEGDLGLFDDRSMSFAYPSRWRSATFGRFSTNVTVIVYLSTEPMVDPCVRAANSIECRGSAVTALGENGLLIDWSRWGFAGWELDPSVGPVVNVVGRRATVQRGPVTDGCAEIGGEVELVVQVERPGVPSNWDEMTACYRGPLLELLEAEIDAMLASVRWKN